MLLLGYDIGGTKSAVITALYENEEIEFLDKKVIQYYRKKPLI